MQYKTLGSYIRQKREEKNISLNKFAVNNDIDTAILSRIERNLQDIKLTILVKIANGFDLLPSELLKEYEKTLGE